MFNTFKSLASNLAGQAADMLAPALKTPFDEFIEAWRNVTNYFVSPQDERAPLQSTDIPANLEIMMEILRDEDRDARESREGAGPCLEYLLTHKILETLCSLGHGDTPIGMKAEVLVFFTNFLQYIDAPTLPNIHVYNPVKRLMRTCHTRKSHPLEEQYVQFLNIVSAKLLDDPACAQFFFDDIPEKDKEKLDRQGRGDGSRELFILEALTDLLGSEDATVVNRACLGLLNLAELKSADVAKYIVSSKRFVTTLIDRLAEKYKQLPQTRKDFGAAAKGRSTGAHAVSNFMTWADYVDDVFRNAQPDVVAYLAVTLRERMLVPVLQERLLQNAEDSAVVATALLNNWLARVKTPALLDCIVEFLLGPEMTAPEKRDQKRHPIRNVLIERCENMSADLTLTTLRFFETLFKRSNQHAVTNLVLRNFPPHALETTDRDLVAVRADVDMWQGLEPPACQAGDSPTDTDYYAYFMDAQREARECEVAMAKWQPAVGGLSIASAVDIPFYEGDFLRMLLAKVERMLDSGYDEMLLVTGLLARIAIFPNASLHAFVLEPRCKVPSGSMTLYATLQTVSKEMAARVDQVPAFPTLLAIARESLDEGYADGEESNFELAEHMPLLRMAILFEEFCKELTAISLVKMSNASP